MIRSIPRLRSGQAPLRVGFAQDQPFGDITGIILAGGRSSRFGSHKALAEVGGIPLIEWTLRTLRPLFGEVLIVTKTPELFCPSQGRIVRDREGEGAGPLVGLYSGLEASATEKNFVCACDMPLLTLAVVTCLCRDAHEAEIVIPRIGKHWQPLCAIYSRRCLPQIRQLIVEGERGLKALLSRRPFHGISIKGMGRALIDVDTPDDLAIIEHTLTSAGMTAGVSS